MKRIIAVGAVFVAILFVAPAPAHAEDVAPGTCGPTYCITKNGIKIWL